MEWKRYFLDEDEMELVHSTEDAEDFLDNMGIEAKEVEFDGDDMISYLVEEEIENDPDDVERGWNERYLNSIGMSMRDFV